MTLVLHKDTYMMYLYAKCDGDEGSSAGNPKSHPMLSNWMDGHGGYKARGVRWRYTLRSNHSPGTGLLFLACSSDQIYRLGGRSPGYDLRLAKTPPHPLQAKALRFSIKGG